MSSFRKKIPESDRYREAVRIKNKYRDRVPVIVEEAKDFPRLDKHKYLVPKDLTLGYFINVLRKRLNFGPESALFLCFNNKVIPPISSDFNKLYEAYKHSDGFLYITVCAENTFG